MRFGFFITRSESMFKKVTQSLLALLLLVQALFPATIVFASETEEGDHDYGDAVEFDGFESEFEDEFDFDFDIEIEDDFIEIEDEAWTDTELAEWEELLEANAEMRDESAYLFEATQALEEAADLHVMHLELYANSNELHEVEIFELDFVDAEELLVKNTEDFEALIEQFEALVETTEEVDEVEMPEVDVIVSENTPEEAPVAPEEAQVAPALEEKPKADRTSTRNNTGRVTVVRGTGGSNSAVAGTSMNIRATVPNGYVFSHWTSTGQWGTFGNSRAQNTTFTPSAFANQGFTTTVTAVMRPRARTSLPTWNISAPAVVRANTHLRRGPGTQYHPTPWAGGKGSIKRGVALTVRNEGSSWSFVTTADGRSGWLPNNRITRINTNGIIVSSGTRLRKSPNSTGRTLTRLNRNAKVVILAEGGTGRIGWVQVQAGKRTGWVQRRDVEDFSQTRRTNRAVTMKSGPGSNFSNVKNGRIKNRKNVEILGRNGGWYQVRYGSRIGYIPRKRTSSVTVNRRLRHDTTVLYSSATTGEKRPTVLSRTRNNRVRVVGQARLGTNRRNPLWTRVRVGKRTGWVLTSNIR